MRTAVRLVLGAFLATISFHSHAKVVTWTLKNVIFNDGGRASGFVTFDPSVPFDAEHPSANYLSRFDIKTTAGRTFTAPFEYTPSNTDAYVRYYVTFFSAPSLPTPRHGLPQRTFRLHAVGGFPATGGSVEIRAEASTEDFLGEDFRSGNSPLFRSISGGRMIGLVVPEPNSWAFIIGLLLLGLSAPMRKVRAKRRSFAPL